MDNTVNKNTGRALYYGEPFLMEIRIFLSSTFCDLQEERSVIVNKVAAALNKRYYDRGIKITIVDLRWGVTEEAARNGKVIEVCMREIQKSRPYFAAILGGRYGWQPGEDDVRRNQSLCSEFPNILEDIREERSITEMEIQYAFLKAGRPETQSLFFFKDLDSIDDKYKDSGQAMEHLLKLKAIIKEKADEGLCTADRFTNPEELGDIFYKRVCELLDRDFPVEDSAVTIKWIYNIQKSNREYERHIGRSIGKHLMQTFELNIPNKYRRFVFYSSHSHDSIRYILAELSFDRISVDEIFLNDFTIEDKYDTVEYYFIPIDIDSYINSAEKFLQIFLYIYGLNENSPEWTMDYEECVKSVRSLKPSRPAVCIIRNLDNLPPEELLKLAFIEELNEWIGFIILCRKSSYHMVFNSLGIDSNEYEVEESPGRLNVSQYLEIIDKRLEEWSKELSATQKLHLLQCQSFGRFHLLNMFLEIINRYGYYERLNEVIDRFVMTRSDKEFIGTVLDMYEQELGREPVKWLLTRIAEDNARLDESILKEEFLRHFKANALEWAAYANMLENVTDKISSHYHIQDTDIKYALAERYGLDVRIEKEEEYNENEEKNNCSSAPDPVYSIRKDEKDEEENEYVRNLPMSIPELVPYARISLATVEDIKSILRDKKAASYASLLKKMKEASLLDEFIAVLKKSDSNENLTTLLWIAMTGVSSEVRFEETLGQIIDRLRLSPDPKLLNAVIKTIFILGNIISDMEIFRNRLRLLHLIYELYPEVPDLEQRILSVIKATGRKYIQDIPDLSGICDFAIKWISYDIPGRFEHFVISLSGMFREEKWYMNDITYTEFLKSFADFYKQNATVYGNARKELLSVFEYKLTDLPMHLKASYGNLMLRLGYDEQSAKTAIIEEKVYWLGMCEFGSKNQTRFFKNIKKLYSFPGYIPSVPIRKLEICNYLMTGHFAEADAVSREGIGHMSAFDYLGHIFKREWNEAAEMADALYRHETALNSDLYFEASSALKVSTLLVYLYKKDSSLDNTMKNLDILWNVYWDHIGLYCNENFWPLRKLISAVYMQRMAMFEDAEEMFRQACQLTATADDLDSETDYGYDVDEMELLNVLQCFTRNEQPKYPDPEVLEKAVVVPGAIVLVYLYEKLYRLDPSDDEYAKTASLIESIRFYRLTDRLISLIPEDWKKRMLTYQSVQHNHI